MYHFKDLNSMSKHKASAQVVRSSSSSEKSPEIQMMILVVSCSVNLDAGRTTLTMTPMNVGRSRASQVAAIAGRKDAAGELIITLMMWHWYQGDLNLAAAFLLPHQWFSLRLVKDGVSDPRLFLMIQNLSILTKTNMKVILLQLNAEGAQRGVKKNSESLKPRRDYL